MAGLRRRLGAHDDVALLERGPQRRELVVAELVLIGERDELLLLDEAALGGLLDEALGRREIVQMNRVGQWNPFRSKAGPRFCGLLGASGARSTRDGRLPCLSYRTALRTSPFPNIANLRFPNTP